MTAKDAIERLEQALKHAGDLQKFADQNREEARGLRKQAEEMLKNATPQEKQRLEDLAERLAKDMQEKQGKDGPKADGPEGDGAERDGPGRSGAERTQVPGGTPQGSPEGKPEPAGGRSSPGDPSGPGKAPQFKTPGAAVEGETAPVDARRRDGSAERVVARWFNPGATGGSGTSKEAMSEDLRQATAGAEKAIEQQVVPGRHSDLIRRVFRRYAERTEGTPAAPKSQDAKDAGGK